MPNRGPKRPSLIHCVPNSALQSQRHHNQEQQNGVSSNANKIIQAQSTLNPGEAGRYLPAAQPSPTKTVKYQEKKGNRPRNKGNRSRVGVLVLAPSIARLPLLVGR
jgi:hypothetical protein